MGKADVYLLQEEILEGKDENGMEGYPGTICVKMWANNGVNEKLEGT